MLFKVFDLAYVALRQGDAVGVQSFGGEQRWLVPRSGPGTSSAVIDGVYDLQPTLEPPDYAEAANRVMTRQRKRALIVLPTNLRDPAASFARSNDRPIFGYQAQRKALKDHRQPLYHGSTVPRVATDSSK